MHKMVKSTAFFFLPIITTATLTVLFWYTISDLNMSVVPVPPSDKDNEENAWSILEATVPSSPVDLMRHRYA